MSYESLIVATIDEFVAEITLNRPRQLNTFDATLAGELLDAFAQLDADEQIRVIIVKGAGKAFCAGIDVSAFAGKKALETSGRTVSCSVVSRCRMLAPPCGHLRSLALQRPGAVSASQVSRFL